MFGATPAHGLLIRHAQGIEVSDFKVITAATEARPCFLLEDVERADFLSVKPGRQNTSPVFVLDNVADFRVASCEGVPDTQVPEAKHKEL